MSVSSYPENFAYTGENPYLDALIYGGAWGSEDATVTIKYAVRSGVDPYDINGLNLGNGWSQVEISALDAAMQAWENVANVDFLRISDVSEANIWYWKGGYDDVGGLAWHEVPTDSIIEPLYGVFADDGAGWTDMGLQAGGFGFLTLLHELGHALGLDHPHPDVPGRSTFPGVSAAFGSYGTYSLNQGIYTVMGFNDGWHAQYPDHSPANGYIDYGYSATPMALDIAAIQEIYGANTSYHSGDNVYVLPDDNSAGTGWATLWDGGGRDAISAAGSARDVRIDLREATLEGEYAGGYLSYAQGIVGGFTIAHGANIENGETGSGDDTLVGNDGDNVLKGHGGDDVLIGGQGADDLFGGAGNDRFNGGSGDDTIWAHGGGGDVISGGSGEDRLRYDDSAGKTFVDLAFDQRGQAYLDYFAEGAAAGSTYSGIEDITGSAYTDDLRGDSGSNRIDGSGGNDRIYGRAGDDHLFGGSGSDSLYGGMGADRMVGGYGDGSRDSFVYFAFQESRAGSGNRDYIAVFSVDEDVIDLTRLDADMSTTAIQDAFHFIGAAEFSGHAGELGYRYEGEDTIVQADLDGDGKADFEIGLQGHLALSASDFLL